LFHCAQPSNTLPLQTMGTLLKSVSKLFVFSAKQASSERSSSATAESCLSLTSVGECVMPQVGNGCDVINGGNDCAEDGAKLRSLAPQIDVPRRASCDDDDSDSGVEKDRSPSDVKNRHRESSCRGDANVPSEGVAVDDRKQHHRSRRSQQAKAKKTSGTRAQVEFEHDVVVHKAFIDEDGNRMSFCDRELLKAYSGRRRSRGDASAASNDYVAAPESTRLRPPTFLTTEIDFQTTEPDIRYQITRESRTGARLLRFCVRLGSAFGGGATVMVKSNSACNEIHLVAYRASAAMASKTSSSRSKSKDIYQTTFPLPVVIDASGLTAFVNTDGLVLIEARVVAPVDPLLERWYGRHPPIVKKTSPSSTGVAKEHRKAKRHSKRHEPIGA